MNKSNLKLCLWASVAIALYELFFYIRESSLALVIIIQSLISAYICYSLIKNINEVSSGLITEEEYKLYKDDIDKISREYPGRDGFNKQIMFVKKKRLGKNIEIMTSK
jgi:hypothetical protein